MTVNGTGKVLSVGIETAVNELNFALEIFEEVWK